MLTPFPINHYEVPICLLEQGIYSSCNIVLLQFYNLFSIIKFQSLWYNAFVIKPHKHRKLLILFLEWDSFKKILDVFMHASTSVCRFTKFFAYFLLGLSCLEYFLLNICINIKVWKELIN